MDWEKTWKQLGSENKDGLESYFQPGKPVKNTGRHPLQQIRRSLMINAFWGVLISAGYVYLMFRFPNWQILLGFSLVLLFNIYSIVKGLQLRSSIPSNISGHSSLLAEMEKQYKAVTDWIRAHKMTAIFIYPVAAASGFMLGGILGSGKPLDLLFSRNIFWISLIISAIALTPVAYWFSKLLVKVTYEKYLKKLKENIDELRKQESSEMT
ncbi:MAG TPA: hypothetical protein VLA58_03680 [Chitinophagaceae bacterium]|nr:hypothetical protein [Chitinophagaceae bacterium]